MGTLQLLNPHGLVSHTVISSTLTSSTRTMIKPSSKSLKFSRGRIRAVGTIPDSESETQEPPAVNFAFISSVLLPDGTPDVHFRTACGGQKLRDIMLDTNMELYGPYSRLLANCSGGGSCGTCVVENSEVIVILTALYQTDKVVQGKELLTPRTDKEKEKLKRNPKNWRLACQTTVGKPDSRGLVVIQQMPEWKLHEWEYRKEAPSET